MANQALIYTIPENYRMLKELGEGCYGRVIKCFKRDTKETVAVKILKQRHSKHRKTGEVLIMEKLKCLDPDKYNIVRCHEWFHRNDQTFVVYEVLDMSLYDYMFKTKRAPLPLNGIRTIIKDVATALNALKDVGLIHTDLKMDNVMLVNHQRQPFRVKLIDFGLTLQTSEAWPGLVVQPLWHRSPEIILGLPFTEAIDIWSLGTMVAEMLIGFTLFPGRNEYDVLRFITDLLGEPPKRLLNGGMNTEMFYHGRRKYLVFMHWTLKTPIEYRSETGIEPKDTRKYRFCSLDGLKTEMLQMDPRDRITPSKILAHPFITRSYLSPSSDRKETAAAETSQAASNSKDTAETKADDRCPIELPPGVIMVQPAEKTMQMKGASKQSSAVSPQAVQNKMADCPKRMDNTAHILEPVGDHDVTYDSGLVLESNTGSAKTSPVVDCGVVTVTSVPPNCRVEAPDSVLNQAALPTSEVSEPKEKKKKKGIRGFFSTLKRKFLCCFHVPEDNEE